VRGHLLTTTGKRLEDVGQRDFLDIVYAYAVNSGEMRHDFREAFLTYSYDLPTAISPEEAGSFEGFTKQSLSLLDELESFTLG
jgi:hypothetical protein